MVTPTNPASDDAIDRAYQLRLINEATAVINCSEEMMPSIPQFVHCGDASLVAEALDLLAKPIGSDV